MADDAVVAAPTVAPVAAPVVAPVIAAPVTPAVPAPPVALPVAATPPVVAPVVAVDPATAEVVFDATGDPGLDVALGFMGKLGLAAEHPAMAAAITGDFNLLKATLATMGDKARGWEQMVALGEQAFKRSSDSAALRATQTTAAVHEQAGGAEGWKAVSEWAAANADPAEKTEINKLFDAGVMGARAAALLLTTMYRSATGTVVTPNPAVKAGAAAVAPTGNGKLSTAEYAVAVRALSSKLGNAMDASPEYAELRARLRR